ncbi:MAG: response regulator transcription factor [Lautropia sp.]|nr:response regulator transcription factor [Lautropia sp.]
MTHPVIRILLIDDHNLFRSGVRQLLQKEADLKIVAEAADGLEGLKRAKATRPDVILLDLNMPGLSGLETLHLLTQDLPESRVIILTVSEEAEELGDALKAGAHGYLTKNIEAETLMSAIRKAVQGQPVISDTMTLKLVEQFRQQTQPRAGKAPVLGQSEPSAAGNASMAGQQAQAMAGSAPVARAAEGALSSSVSQMDRAPGMMPRTGVGVVAGAAARAGAAAGLAPTAGTLSDEVARLTAREREIAQCLSRGESNKEIARHLGVAESTVKIHVQNIMKKLHLSSRVQVAVYAVEHGLSAHVTDERT